MDAVKHWINSQRDYDAGVALYNQYGDDRRMKALFREGKTQFKEKKLLELMQGLIKNGASVKNTLQGKHQAIRAQSENRNGWPAKLDGPLKALYDEWILKFKESSSLEARIYDVALAGISDPNYERQAGQMAHRILDLRDEIRNIYQKRDHYIQHGVFPGQKMLFKPVVADPLKLAERRLNLRRYLTRLKNELAKPGKPHTRLRQETQWKQYCEEMRYINEKLKRPENEGIPARNQQTDIGKGAA